jgi:hypothetical protein
MHFFRAFWFSWFLALVGGVAINDFKLFEEIYSAPEGWEVVASPFPDNRISFRIALHAVSSPKL